MKNFPTDSIDALADVLITKSNKPSINVSYGVTWPNGFDVTIRNPDYKGDYYNKTFTADTDAKSFRSALSHALTLQGALKGKGVDVTVFHADSDDIRLFADIGRFAYLAGEELRMSRGWIK